MKDRLPQIDGLRGLAILGVIWQHAYAPKAVKLIVASGAAKYPWIVGDGWFGVPLFFVLSGFVLAMPFIGREAGIMHRPVMIKFYRRRAMRLYPLFTIVCVVGMIVFSAPLWSVPFTLSTLHLFSPSEFLPRANPAFWSLSVEIWFSAAMPLLLFLGWRFGYGRVAFSALMVSITIRLIGSQFIFPQVNPIWSSAFACGDTFVFGILIAKLYASGWRAPRYTILIGAVGLVASMIGWDAMSGNGPTYMASAFTMAIGTLGLAAIVAACLSDRSTFARMISVWPLRLLGAMCFSVYSWHLIVLHFVDPTNGITASLAFWVILICLSFFSYRLIEFPKSTFRVEVSTNPSVPRPT